MPAHHRITPMDVFANAETLQKLIIVALLVSAVAALVVLVGVSHWFTTTYRIGESQVELRTGLLRRRHLAVPLDRVRSVDATASPMSGVFLSAYKSATDVVVVIVNTNTATASLNVSTSGSTILLV